MKARTMADSTPARMVRGTTPTLGSATSDRSPDLSPARSLDAQPAQGTTFDPYCEWFGKNFKGIQASMEHIEPDGSHVVEFQNRPLISIQAHIGANNVRGIRFTFAVNKHTRVFEITGVRAIHLEHDAAGFPKFLELTNDDETLVLRFTGNVQSAPTYSGNSWGE